MYLPENICCQSGGIEIHIGFYMAQRMTIVLYFSGLQLRSEKQSKMTLGRKKASNGMGLIQLCDEKKCLAMRLISSFSFVRI